MERSETVVEFTARAVAAGIIFGVIFGSAHAYLGLRVGLTVWTSIPIAVLTVALFKLMPQRRDSVILEANMSQTIGSASSSLATGTTFTTPARFTFGSPELPAPQATLMKTVIEGVLSGSLPWGLVLSGAALAVCALIAGLPGLSFAIGIYLPLSTLAPLFVGGIVRRIVESKRDHSPRRTSSGSKARQQSSLGSWSCSGCAL